MDIQIRKMNSGDVEAVYKYGIEEKSFSNDSGSFWSKEQLFNWVESNEDIMLVVDFENEIVGFSLYSVHVPTRKVTWENLFVAPNFRGKGVASALINAAQEQMVERGYVYVAGIVNAKNKSEFIPLAEKHGFKNNGSVIWIDKFI